MLMLILDVLAVLLALAAVGFLLVKYRQKKRFSKRQRIMDRRRQVVRNLEELLEEPWVLALAQQLDRTVKVKIQPLMLPDDSPFRHVNLEVEWCPAMFVAKSRQFLAIAKDGKLESSKVAAKLAQAYFLAIHAALEALKRSHPASAPASPVGIFTCWPSEDRK